MERILLEGERAKEAQRREWTANPIFMDLRSSNSSGWVLQCIIRTRPNLGTRQTKNTAYPHCSRQRSFMTPTAMPPVFVAMV